MAYLSGILQRPLLAAAAAMGVTSATVDIPDRLFCCSSSASRSASTSVEPKTSWVSHISVSKLAHLSFVNRVEVPLPDVHFPLPDSCHASAPHLPPSVASFPALLSSYQSADLPKASKPTICINSTLSSPPDVLYRWHLPEPTARDAPGCFSEKSRTVVVLLGWLGAKQKHLRRYAELYTSMGFHAITFTFPVSEIIGYHGGKLEKDIELLVDHLTDWLEEHGKNVVFHTFSNTGWLTYGAILEKFKNQDPSLMGKIKGCIVDSAPVAAPDPLVFASGFSAAFLKKRSVATKGLTAMDLSVGYKSEAEPKRPVTEAALLLLLKKFFEVVLNLPTVSRRLSDVLGILSSAQPTCPQLYIYSSADRVIPADYVESFAEEQRKAGRVVRSCNFVSTPHVDHFRSDPKLYTSEVTQFLEDYVFECRKHSL